MAKVTKRPLINTEHEFACWDFQENPRPTPKPRVVVVHQDKSIGESLALLLAREGYEAVHTEAITKARIFVSRWKPHAILLDTRLDAVSHYSFARQLRADETSRELMLLAMSNIWPSDSVPAMRQAGFNAHCRRPCSLWRVVDALDAWFKQA